MIRIPPPTAPPIIVAKCVLYDVGDLQLQGVSKTYYDRRFEGLFPVEGDVEVDIIA